MSVFPPFNLPANIQPNSTEGFKSQGWLLSPYSLYENRQPERGVSGKGPEISAALIRCERLQTGESHQQGPSCW